MWCKVRTSLDLDPRRRGSLPLHYPVHEELLTTNEGVLVFDRPSDGLPAALHIIEVPRKSRFLQVNELRAQTH